MESHIFEDIVKPVELLCKLIGLSTVHNIKITTFFVVQYISLIIMVSLEVKYFVEKCSKENFLELTALGPIISIGVLSLLKITCIVIKGRNIAEELKSYKELYTEITADENSFELVKKGVRLIYRLVKYYINLNMFLSFIYCVNTLLVVVYAIFVLGETNYMIPYPISVPFEMDTWYKWSVVYVFCGWNGFICTFFFTIVDSLYVYMAFFVYMNFTVLCEDIQQLDKDATHALRNILLRHQSILTLSENVEDIFTLTNLFNVLIGSIDVCLLGFNITMGPKSQIPRIGLFLSSVLVQIFMMSYFGENLISESQRIAQSAYNCNWQEMDDVSKKSILLLITRANKPQKLTAYKFSVIGYESFSKIISTSWSYFTILQTVYKPPED